MPPASKAKREKGEHDRPENQYSRIPPARLRASERQPVENNTAQRSPRSKSTFDTLSCLLDRTRDTIGVMIPASKAPQTARDFSCPRLLETRSLSPFERPLRNSTPILRAPGSADTALMESRPPRRRSIHPKTIHFQRNVNLM